MAKRQLRSISIKQKQLIGASLAFVIVGFVLLFTSTAATLINAIEPEGGTLATAQVVNDATASAGKAILFARSGSTPKPTSTGNSNYDSNLAMIMAVPSKWRNTTWEDSPYLDTPSAQLPIENLLGTREEHSAHPDDAVHNQQFYDGGPEGQFRTICEFSHFAYDDPIVYPGQPGKSHLHMFFGNSVMNAYSGNNSKYNPASGKVEGDNDVLNQGGGTCNGGELNRTGYWAPALIDDEGNVRVPLKILVYYKNYSNEPGTSNVYPEGMRMVASSDIMRASMEEDGGNSLAYKCNTEMNSGPSQQTSGPIPVCGSNGRSPGSDISVLEVDTRLQTCWNGQDPTDYVNNLKIVNAPCKYRQDEFTTQFPHITMKIHYPIFAGEDTAGWFVVSDVNPSSYAIGEPYGYTIHTDWWNGWNPTINKEWIDNCNNQAGADCAASWLNRNATRVLKVREQYTGDYIIPGAELFPYLCKTGRTISKPADIAYCTP